MTTTAPTPPDGDKKERAPRSEAELGIEEVEFLPPSPGRTSKLAELLDKVKAEHPGKWLVVSKYEKAGAASAAASTLRAKYGPVEANGWSFATRSIEGGAKVALFVNYEGNKIVPGQADAWNKVRAEKQAKSLAKKAEKDKAEAKREEKRSRHQ